MAGSAIDPLTIAPLPARSSRASSRDDAGAPDGAFDAELSLARDAQRPQAQRSRSGSTQARGRADAPGDRSLDRAVERPGSERPTSERPTSSTQGPDDAVGSEPTATATATAEATVDPALVAGLAVTPLAALRPLVPAPAMPGVTAEAGVGSEEESASASSGLSGQTGHIGQASAAGGALIGAQLGLAGRVAGQALLGAATPEAGPTDSAPASSSTLLDAGSSPSVAAGVTAQGTPVPAGDGEGAGGSAQEGIGPDGTNSAAVAVAPDGSVAAQTAALTVSGPLAGRLSATAVAGTRADGPALDVRLPRNPLTARAEGNRAAAADAGVGDPASDPGGAFATRLSAHLSGDAAASSGTDQGGQGGPGQQGQQGQAAVAASSTAAASSTDGGPVLVQAPGTSPTAATAAASAPGEAPAARPTPAAQLAPEVTRLVQAGPGTHRVVMRLDPEHLGQVRVTLTLAGGEVQVRLAAESAQARAALAGDAADLHRALERALPGLQDARITIQAADGSSTTSTHTQHGSQHGTQHGAGQNFSDGQPEDLNPQGDQPMTDVTDQSAPRDSGASTSDRRHDAAGRAGSAGTRTSTIARDGATSGADAPTTHPTSGRSRLDVRV
ncbi:flagellar hook-length control protein FliK [Nocardioides sp. GY 10127]|uniref:flagellar hook-length control protein FliK n=1 Tax=Nocardioides sp. GY 10127 TaxID=2569762 RepID=UPI0010A8160C|nr:flagellar hook-length control protein FliK [Nocardioides sp. GY 10127]TIC78632.1 hypothetical protein E8D37_19465 [Nocardioides sp. GY 10127]